MKSALNYRLRKRNTWWTKYHQVCQWASEPATGVVMTCLGVVMARLGVVMAGLGVVGPGCGDNRSRVGDGRPECGDSRPGCGDSSPGCGDDTTYMWWWHAIKARRIPNIILWDGGCLDTFGSKCQQHNLMGKDGLNAQTPRHCSSPVHYVHRKVAENVKFAGEEYELKPAVWIYDSSLSLCGGKYVVSTYSTNIIM